MANPYKKAEEINKKPPGGVRKVEEPIVEEKTTPTPSKQNLLEGMLEPKQEGKSYGFYLSNEAVEKLEKLAKQNKCSKSKALDTLLRSIL